MNEKLQKVLARVGLGSRRNMEAVISAGRVSVNGKVAQLGDRIAATDELRIDGRKVNFQIEQDIRRRVIIYYKPEGEICSRHDPDSRPTVFDQLPNINNDRWVMVGRLDINSSGLLLFTNDGELANRLMHPSNQIEREYAVRVMGEVTPQIQRTLTQGVELEDGPAKFERFAELGGDGINRWYQVVVKEGRNREVRRLFESQGLKVSRLLRTRYGTILLPRELRTGRWIELDKHAIDTLTDSVELRPRQGTGLYGITKRRTEKMFENPLPARRGYSSIAKRQAHHTPKSPTSVNELTQSNLHGDKQQPHQAQQRPASSGRSNSGSHIRHPYAKRMEQYEKKAWVDHQDSGFERKNQQQTPPTQHRGSLNNDERSGRYNTSRSTHTSDHPDSRANHQKVNQYPNRNRNADNLDGQTQTGQRPSQGFARQGNRPTTESTHSPNSRYKGQSQNRSHDWTQPQSNDSRHPQRPHQRNNQGTGHDQSRRNDGRPYQPKSRHPANRNARHDRQGLDLRNPRTGDHRKTNEEL